MNLMAILLLSLLIYSNELPALLTSALFNFKVNHVSLITLLSLSIYLQTVCRDRQSSRKGIMLTLGPEGLGPSFDL